MIEQLLSAIQDNAQWRDAFARLRYEGAFKSYCGQYQPLYRMAVESAESVEQLANDLMDGLETGWRKQRIWDRGRIRAEEKSMIVTYLDPMLLAIGDPACTRLAHALREVWCSRRKDDVYEVADYDTLKSGFKNRIFGIEISKRK